MVFYFLTHTTYILGQDAIKFAETLFRKRNGGGNTTSAEIYHRYSHQSYEPFLLFNILQQIPLI